MGESVCPEYIHSQAEVCGPRREPDRERQAMFATGGNVEAGTSVGTKDLGMRSKVAICYKLAQQERFTRVSAPLFPVQEPLVPK